MLLTLLLASALGLAKASLIDNGTVVTIDGIPYYAGGISLGRLSVNSSPQAMVFASSIPGRNLFPLTIIETASTFFTPAELLNTTTRYNDTDDVFRPAFLQNIFVHPKGVARTAIDMPSLGASLRAMKTSFVIASEGLQGKCNGTVALTGSITGDLAKGPYFVSTATGDIFRAYRLYDDDYLAFIQGVIGDEQGGFLSLPAVTENAMAKSVAVPSKLYYTPTEEQPLAGLRLGVKDIYHVKGVGTSGGNRAYFYLYGPQNETGPAVQRLLDLGAVLVGKMGTVQFANGDRPTADWVDFHAPFNPRGDGYQLPSGSSSGSGAGIAAYEWLDLAVGSDTGGSMRGPASVQGVYGGRPSTGAISMDGVIPLSPVSDTAGVFARSGSLWAKTTQAWYPDFKTNYTSYPKTIYRSVAASDWTSSPIRPVVANLIDTWFAKLEGFMQFNSTIANLTSRWEETHGSAPANLSEMLYPTYGVYITHDQWRLLGKQFFEDYAAKFDGRQPFVNPGPLARWKWGQANADNATYAQALQNITIFKEWYETEGFGRHDPESCSEGLYVYPFSIGEPSYRNVYTAEPTGPPLGFGDSSVSILAGVPEVVVPIGEVPYNSTVSLHEEYLPVTMALRMARGCDYVLASLVSDLEGAGVLHKVETGKRLYK